MGRVFFCLSISCVVRLAHCRVRRHSEIRRAPVVRSSSRAALPAGFVNAPGPCLSLRRASTLGVESGWLPMLRLHFLVLDGARPSSPSVEPSLVSPSRPFVSGQAWDGHGACGEGCIRNGTRAVMDAHASVGSLPLFCEPPCELSLH